MSTVATRDNSPSGVVAGYTQEFAQVLPTHIRPETWTRLAVGALRQNPALRDAAARDMGSLMQALMEAARLGLEPGTSQFYLTVRGGKVLGVVGYRGEIEMIYRAGAVSSVIVEAVYKNDKFTYAPGVHERPIHEIDWDSEDRGPLRLAYAYAVMKDGATSKVVVAGKARLDRAKQASSTAGKSHSPWTTDEAAMAMKTAVHDLTKFVPTSSEFMKDQLRAVRDVATEIPARPAPDAIPEPAVDTTTGEVIDAEYAEEVAQ